MNFAKAHFISIFSECVIATPPPPPSPLSYIQCKETKTFKSISELGYMFVLKYSILAAEDRKMIKLIRCTKYVKESLRYVSYQL